MYPRAHVLIDALSLAPHPEGGRYRRVHASAERVRTGADGRERAALTSIHFLLCAGEFSRWHRVDADEAWHHAEGDPLELLVYEPASATLARHRLGRLDALGASPLVVVPAHCWQAARPLGEYALAGCSVGPGFEFAGFALLDTAPDVAAALAALDPELARLA